MANLRRSSSSLQGLTPAAPLRQAGVRRWPVIAVVLTLAGLVLAWIEGGEEPLRPIAAPVDLPGEQQ